MPLGGSIIMSLPPAVVVGLNDTGLSIVRSLGRRGVRIVGLYDDPRDYCLKSRYLARKIRQSPLYGESLIETLIQDVSHTLRERAVLFCASDRSVLTACGHKDSLSPHFYFVLPSYEVASTQISKKSFQDFAVRNSFLIPKAFFTSKAEQIHEVSEQISFPCVVKPEFRDRDWNDKVPEKVLYIESKQNFLRLIEEYNIQDSPLIIQEWIDGNDSHVYFCLAYISAEHGPVAHVTGRKLSQHPHLTGSTAIAETVWLPDLANESLRLLREAKCVGLCSVEFKCSNKDGLFYLTEPTVGRADTQEGLAIASGVDLPYIAYLDATGRTAVPAQRFTLGVKWINEPLAFYSSQMYIKGGIRDLGRLLELFRGNRSYSLCAVDDVMPALDFLRDKALAGLRKLAKLPVLAVKNHLR